MIKRSFVIPVLDLSTHSPYNILTLLKDLEEVDGEVICILNSEIAFNMLKTHPRITKFCYNNTNVGVSRSWNQGLILAESDTVFICNADIHIQPAAIEKMETFLRDLPDAAIVGPQGTHLNYDPLGVVQTFSKHDFDQPVKTDDVSGFLFCLSLPKFQQNDLWFDTRYTPCFFEEWDMGLQVKRAGLATYAVPVTEYEHVWGTSKQPENTSLHFLNQTKTLAEIMAENQQKFIDKWALKTA